jgi:hypothetical protein
MAAMFIHCVLTYTVAYSLGVERASVELVMTITGSREGKERGGSWKERRVEMNKHVN